MFVALQAQNDDKLLSVSAPGTAASVKVAGGTVDLPSQSLVDLEGPAPQIVLTGLTKPLTGGETIQLDFIFASVGVVTLNVPVEPQAYAYATYSPPRQTDAHGQRPGRRPGRRLGVAVRVRVGVGDRASPTASPSPTP